MEDQKFTHRKPTQPQIVFEHGKIQPQAIDFEEVLLGTMMVSKKQMESVVDMLKPEVFYKDEHQRIFMAVQKLYGMRKPVDMLTVVEQLRQAGELELIGGAYYIATLTNKTLSGELDFHARILLQKFVQRELIRVSSDIIHDSYEDTTDVFELLDKSERELNNVRSFTLSGGGLRHISEIGKDARKELHKREKMAKEGKCVGVPTPLAELTKLTRGWQPSDLIILAGRPGQGKTSLLIAIAKFAAQNGVPVCLYELEMSSVSLYNKLILSECEIHISNFLSGYMDVSDWSEYNSAEYRLAQLPIYVDDNPMVNMAYVRNHSKMMRKKGLCGLIGIDYLQLADMETEKKNRNREREVADTSRMAKIIAKELEVPVMLLSQLNREVEKRSKPKPQLSDLRDSGAIEQDADIVMFTYLPAKYGVTEDDNGTSTDGLGIISFAKHRNGACRDIFYKHNDSMTKIFDYTTEAF